MKRTLKLTGILLAFVIAISAFLCGCSEKSATDGGITTITMWSPDAGSKAVMSELIEEFNNTIGKENNIKFDYQVKEGDIKEQIDLALTTDQAPDLFITGDMQKHSENGHIIALEDVPGSEKLLDRYGEGDLREYDHTFSGKTYCLPFSRNTYGLIYNKDMFKKAGIVDENGEPTPPETFDELREYAKRLTNKSKKEFGIIFPLKWGSWLNQEITCNLMSAYGRSYYVPTTGEYDFSILQKPLEMVMGIKKDESYYPGAENIDNDVARARFAEGGIGMKFAVSWDVGVLNDQFPAKCDWGVAPLPVADKNDKYMQHCSQSTGPFINKKAIETKGAENVLLVYEWFHSDDVLRKLYEGGVYIPWDYDIIKDVKLKDAKTGWEDFAALNEISVLDPILRSSDVTGKTSLGTLFLNDVWTEKGTIKDCLKTITDTYNEGIPKYKELNPDYDGTTAILKEWNIKR